MTEVLERCLDLLLSTNWLGLSRLGGIHVKATNGRRALSVARNLPAAVLDECARCRLDLRPGEAPGLLALCRSGCTGEARGQTGIVLDDTDGSRHHCLALTADQETFPACCWSLTTVRERMATIAATFSMRSRRFSGAMSSARNAGGITAKVLAGGRAELECHPDRQRDIGNRVRQCGIHAHYRIPRRGGARMNPRLLQSGKSDLAVYADIWARLLRGDSWSGELVKPPWDGSDYICQQVISPIRGKDGRVSHYASIGGMSPNTRPSLSSWSGIASISRNWSRNERGNRCREQGVGAAGAVRSHGCRQHFQYRHVLGPIFAAVSPMPVSGLVRPVARRGGWQALSRGGERRVVRKPTRNASAPRWPASGSSSSACCAMPTAACAFCARPMCADIVDGEVRVLCSAVCRRHRSQRKRDGPCRARTADLERAQAIAHVGSWKLDIANDVLAWSSETYRIFGVRPGTPLNMAVFSIAFIGRPSARDCGLAGGVGRSPHDIEHRVRAGETVKWVREQAEVIFDADGSAVSGVGAVPGHYTLAKAAKEATQQALDVARRLSAAKPEFLANMSHGSARRSTRYSVWRNSASRTAPGARPRIPSAASSNRAGTYSAS